MGELHSLDIIIANDKNKIKRNAKMLQNKFNKFILQQIMKNSEK